MIQLLVFIFIILYPFQANSANSLLDANSALTQDETTTRIAISEHVNQVVKDADFAAMIMFRDDPLLHFNILDKQIRSKPFTSCACGIALTEGIAPLIIRLTLQLNTKKQQELTTLANKGVMQKTRSLGISYLKQCFENLSPIYPLYGIAAEKLINAGETSICKKIMADVLGNRRYKLFRGILPYGYTYNIISGNLKPDVALFTLSIDRKVQLLKLLLKQPKHMSYAWDRIEELFAYSYSKRIRALVAGELLDYITKYYPDEMPLSTYITVLQYASQTPDFFKCITTTEKYLPAKQAFFQIFGNAGSLGYYGKCKPTITFVATKETMGNGKNPETMDCFKGIQYPWLSMVIPKLAPYNLDWEVLDWADEHINWSKKDLVVMGPTWGYTEHIPKFKVFLERLHKSGAVVINSPKSVLWNLNKTYLQEFPEDMRIPSIFIQPGDIAKPMEFYFRHFNTETLIIKGIVDAGAFGLKKITKNQAQQGEQHILHLLKNNEGAIIQPFLDMSFGEMSVVFCGPVATHAFVKTPRKNDFRTQPFYGASTSQFRTIIKPKFKLAGLVSIKEIGIFVNNPRVTHDFLPVNTVANHTQNETPNKLSPAKLHDAFVYSYSVREKLKQILNSQEIKPPLFLRVDLRLSKGKPQIMELEYIEPYVDMQASEKYDCLESIPYGLPKVDNVSQFFVDMMVKKLIIGISEKARTKLLK